MIDTITKRIKRLLTALAVCITIVTACMLAGCAVENDPPPDDENKTYSVIYTVNDENGGFIRGDAEQQIAEGGDGKLVTAVANIGYVFVDWSDGVTAQSRKELDVTESLSLIANFGRIYLNVEYSTEHGGTINGTIKQNVPYGENAEKVIAVPDVGYRFVKWSDGNTNAERIDVDIERSLNVVAQFEHLFDGKGTAVEPYLIGDYKGLCDMAYYPTGAFLLVDDLDVSNIVHEPIFTESEFNGTFDGGEHTISGLNVNRGTDEPSLFGRIGADGHIKNLTISGADMQVGLQGDDGDVSAGVIASVSFGHIQNIKVVGIICVCKSLGRFYVGGLVGEARSGSISDCDVTIDIQNTGRVASLYVGGIMGKGANTEIRVCAVNGIVYINDPIECEIGGVAAIYKKDVDKEITISNNKITFKHKSEVSVYGGLFVECHGGANDLLRVEDCVVTNNAENCRAFAGFIVDADYVDIENCHVLNNEIKACNDGAGFVLRSDYSIINGCGADGNIEATNRANGFCDKASYTEFTDCYSVGEFSGNVATGFTWDILRGNASRCYSKGKVMPKVQGAGFAYIVRSTVSDCYSQCDVIVTNTDPDNEYSTYVGGFICRLGGSRLSNCYYSGSVRGSVYSLGAPGNFPREYFVGAFIGKTTGTNTIENCHVLHTEKGYATDVVANSVMSTGEPDIVVYDELQSMYGLADILNGDRADVWKNIYNACPDLIGIDRA